MVRFLGVPFLGNKERRRRVFVFSAIKKGRKERGRQEKKRKRFILEKQEFRVSGDFGCLDVDGSVDEIGESPTGT